MFFENVIKNTLANRQFSDVNTLKWFQLSLFFFFEIIGNDTPFLTVKTINIFFYVSTIIIVKHTYIVLNANYNTTTHKGDESSLNFIFLRDC